MLMVPLVWYLHFFSLYRAARKKGENSQSYSNSIAIICYPTTRFALADLTTEFREDLVACTHSVIFSTFETKQVYVQAHTHGGLKDDAPTRQNPYGRGRRGRCAPTSMASRISGTGRLHFRFLI
jgi:hypothetical protein